MKLWAKAGLIGFIAAFIGLWIILFILGHDASGWKCIGLDSSSYCSFSTFAFSFINWGFVLFFSWVGFFGGVIDARIIKKIIKKRGDERKIPLKITSTILLTLVSIFAAIGILVFDQWVIIMIYTIIFVLFIIFLSWLISKWKYKG
jgi:hypothetical protein